MSPNTIHGIAFGDTWRTPAGVSEHDTQATCRRPAANIYRASAADGLGMVCGDTCRAPAGVSEHDTAYGVRRHLQPFSHLLLEVASLEAGNFAAGLRMAAGASEHLTAYGVRRHLADSGRCLRTRYPSHLQQTSCKCSPRFCGRRLGYGVRRHAIPCMVFGDTCSRSHTCCSKLPASVT